MKCKRGENLSLVLSAEFIQDYLLLACGTLKVSDEPGQEIQKEGFGSYLSNHKASQIRGH